MGKQSKFSRVTEFVKHVQQSALIAHGGGVYFFVKGAFIAVSVGAADAGKPIKLDATGKIDSSMLPPGSITDELVKVGAAGTPDYLNENDFKQSVDSHIEIKQVEGGTW